MTVPSTYRPYILYDKAARGVTRRNRSDFFKPPYVDKTDIKDIPDVEHFGGQADLV